MLTPGIKGHAALRVTTENTALAMGSGELPVLATPAVAALIERACWQSVAADLLFPTITKIFSIMDEYYGDFAVILSDEGATLDQLFRFVPALARRFKYIIDISQYTEQDYR